MARPAASSRSTSGRIDYLRADRPRRRPDRAGPGLCPGAGPVARRRDARAAVHRHARARHEHDRAVARRAQAAAGPGAAERRRRPVQRRARAHLQASTTTRACAVEGESFDFGNGDVAIAAITSCTNTSNPSVLVAAGLVARKARAKGLTSKPWVKTSLAPGSQVVTDYLNESGLSEDLERARLRPRRLRLHDLHRQFRAAAPSRSARRSTTTTWSRSACFRATAISKAACRPTAAPIISPRRRWWSPMRSRARSGPTWSTSRSAPATNGEPVFLKDIWPTNEEIRALIDAHVHSDMFRTPLCRRLSRRRALAGDRGRPAARPTAGRPARPTSRTRPTSPA